MPPTSGEFNFPWLESVVYGPGKISAVARELARRHVRRAVIVTTKTLGRSKLLDKVKDAMGTALAGVFAETSQHVPMKTIAALVAEARLLNADSFVSFGGGTPIDTAKGAAMAMMGGKLPQGVDVDAASGSVADFPHIAIPTTLSAGEATPLPGLPAGGAARERGGGGAAVAGAQCNPGSRSDCRNSRVAMDRDRDARDGSRGRGDLLE